MKFIHIFKDGKMDEIDFTDKKFNEKKLIKYFLKMSKSQGSENIKRLYTWGFDDSKILCYGWYDGVDGFENIHELPPSGISDFIDEDSSLKKLYGDLFIIRIKDDKYSDITIGDYSVFYSDQVDDYSDYETGDSSEEESNIDNIIEDKLIDEYEIINNDYDELDYDNNDYK
tara:strand:+ start:42 stop:554 length:513 start_codon:yes stop_codon:yes gene_type:complete